MKNIILVIIAIVLVVTAGWGVWNFYSLYQQSQNGYLGQNVALTNANQNSNQNINLVDETNNLQIPANDYNATDYTDVDYNLINSNTNVNVSAPIPSNPITEPAQQPLITISSPADNSHVMTPINIIGQAKKGLKKVNLRITNLAGAPMINLTADVKFPKASSEWGDFKAKVAYEFSQTKEGYLEIYTENANGDRENIVKVHLFFD